jgi:hypothetical protein
MVQYKLTESDKEQILRDHVLPIHGVRDSDVEYVLGFLEAYRYHPKYRRGLYFNRPKNWTKAYVQAIDKIACFFKYGDDLNNGPSIPN